MTAHAARKFPSLLPAGFERVLLNPDQEALDGLAIYTSPAGQMVSQSDFCSRGPRYDPHW